MRSKRCAMQNQGITLNLLLVWFLFSLVSNSKEQTKTRLKQIISLPFS